MFVWIWDVDVRTYLKRFSFRFHKCITSSVKSTVERTLPTWSHLSILHFKSQLSLSFPNTTIPDAHRCCFITLSSQSSFSQSAERRFCPFEVSFGRHVIRLRSKQSLPLNSYLSHCRIRSFRGEDVNNSFSELTCQRHKSTSPSTYWGFFFLVLFWGFLVRWQFSCLDL